MSEFAKSVREAGQQIAQWAKSGGGSAAEWWEEKSALQARAGQIRRLNRQRREMVTGIGSKVYTLHQRGKVRNRDLLADCERVDEINGEIEQLKVEMEEIRSRKRRADLEPEELEDESPVVDESDVDVSVAAVEELGKEEDAAEAPAEAEEEPEGAQQEDAAEEAEGPSEEAGQDTEGSPPAPAFD